MSLLSYSGITTKIRAMSGKLLTLEDYDQISGLTSVNEFVTYLKDKPAYAHLFANVDADSLHRGEIEKILNNGTYDDFQRIYRFSDISQRNFLELYFMKFEVSLIKSCLRMIVNKKNPDLNLALLQDFVSKHGNIDLSKLSNSSDIDELIEQLKNSEFYAPLAEVRDCQNATLFDYEMKLDLFYFTTMWKKRKKFLSGTDLDIITHTLGSQIDMLNIQWIYRSKKYYNMPNSDIYQLIIPINYKLKRTQLTRLIESESLNDFEQILNTTYYKNTFISLEELTLEESYNTLLDKLHLSDSRKKPYTVAIMNTYLYNKEAEVQKLTTALECIRYGYQQSQIKSYLKK